jgi:hypothetical protein
VNIIANFREKKFETTLMEYSGAWGKLIHQKTLKLKISWHCPFKYSQMRYVQGGSSTGLPGAGAGAAQD